MSPANSPVATVLQQFFNIVPTQVLWTIDLRPLGGIIPITTAQAIFTAYALGLIACAATAALRSERRDPRALVALTAPWLIAAATLSPAVGGAWIIAALLSAAWTGAARGMIVAALGLLLIVFASA